MISISISYLWNVWLNALLLNKMVPNLEFAITITITWDFPVVCGASTVPLDKDMEVWSLDLTSRPRTNKQWQSDGNNRIHLPIIVTGAQR